MRYLIAYSQKGMTLVEILISTALLGGVSLITMKLMSDQATSQAFLKTNASISATLSKVESYLSNPVTCKAILKNIVVPPTGNTILGNSGVPNEPKVLFYPHPTAGGDVTVLGESNYGDFSIPNNGIVLRQSAFGKSVAEMEITFAIENKSFLARGKQNITKKIQFVVQKTPSSAVAPLVPNAIENCGPVLKDSEASGKQKMCNSLGGAASWDSSTSKCVLNAVKCDYGYVATRLTSLGGVICDRIESRVNLNEIFDMSSSTCDSTPSYQIIIQGGKFKVICN